MNHPVDPSHHVFEPGDAEMDPITADYVEGGVPICAVCGRGGWQLAAPCPGEQRAFILDENDV